MFSRVNTTSESWGGGEVCVDQRQGAEDVLDLEMYRRQPSLRLSSRFNRPKKHTRTVDGCYQLNDSKKSVLPNPSVCNGLAEQPYAFLSSSSPSSQEALSQSPQLPFMGRVKPEERYGREPFGGKEGACRDDSRVSPTSAAGYNEVAYRGTGLRNKTPLRKEWQKVSSKDQPLAATLRNHKDEEAIDVSAVSIGALRRITELEAELREEKNRAAALSRRLDHLASNAEQSSLLTSAPQRAPVSPALPTWIGASREDLLSRRLRQTETQLKCAKTRASELAGRVEELELTAAAAASAAQENLQVCEEQLRCSQSEIHSLREKVRLLERRLAQKEEERGSDVPILTQRGHDKAKLEQWEKDLEKQKAALSADMANVKEHKDALVRERLALEAERDALAEESQRFTEKVTQCEKDKKAHGGMIEAVKAETRLLPQRLVKEKMDLHNKCLTVVKQECISVISRETQNAVERIQSLKTRLEAALGTQEVLKQQLTTAQRMAGIGNLLPAPQSLASATSCEGDSASGPQGQGKRGVSSRGRKTATVGYTQPSLSDAAHPIEQSEEGNERDPVNGAPSSPTTVSSAVVCRGQPLQKKMKTRGSQERRTPITGTVKSGAEEHASPERPASPTGRRRRRKLGAAEEPVIPDGGEAEPEPDRKKAI